MQFAIHRLCYGYLLSCDIKNLKHKIKISKLKSDFDPVVFNQFKL